MWSSTDRVDQGDHGFQSSLKLCRNFGERPALRPSSSCVLEMPRSCFRFLSTSLMTFCVRIYFLWFHKRASAAGFRPSFDPDAAPSIPPLDASDNTIVTKIQQAVDYKKESSGEFPPKSKQNFAICIRDWTKIAIYDFNLKLHKNPREVCTVQTSKKAIHRSNNPIGLY